MNHSIFRSLRSLTLFLIVSVTLTGCGGADGPQESELEAPFSDMVLHHVVADASLQSSRQPIRLRATGGQLSSEISQLTVYLDDSIVPTAYLDVTNNDLLISAARLEGLHKLVIYAPDTLGNAAVVDIELWDGQNDVRGYVRDDSGVPVAGAAVIASIGDDQRFNAAVVTGSDGSYYLRNFPARTTLVHVTGPTGNPGITSGIPGYPFSDVILRPFGVPVATPNLDFQEGTAGWAASEGAILTLTPHVENPGPATQADVQRNTPPQGADPNSSYEAAALTLNPYDLVLKTQGQGTRTATHIFNPLARARSVRIRYRFQTEEFPRYYGTKFNDSFGVTLRTQGGKVALTSGTLNGMPRAAFDGSRSTAWRDLVIPLSANGESVEISLSVANVADSACQSQIVVDIVDTSPLIISSAALFDIDRTPLQFLSASEHAYFSGQTRVHASFTIQGPADERLTSLTLHVLQDGVIKATGRLLASLESVVYRKFDGQPIVLEGPQMAFEISAVELVNIGSQTDGELALKLVAVTNTQEKTEYDLGQTPLLSRWSGIDRYGKRDFNRGGDDWALPSTNNVCSAVQVTWGDFSNMNGGSFAPDHITHRSGTDVDGWFVGYQNLDTASAKKMLSFLNTEGVGSRVKFVYVTHLMTDGAPFYDAYKRVVLADGRMAKDVIKHRPGHSTHFHWRLG